MGIENLQQEILETANKKAEERIASAKTEAKQILKQAEDEAKLAAKKGTSETQKTIEAMESRELSTAKFDARKAKFEKQQELIDEVFKEAEEKLDGMSQGERDKIVQQLLKQAEKETEVFYVKGNQKDKKAAGSYAFEEAKMLGGVIAETKDRTVSIDLSYEQLLGQIKAEKLQEIAKILF